MELDNREIAFLAWFFVIAGAVLWITRPSKALRDLLKLLVKPPILGTFLMVGLYVVACVWLLSVPGLWQWSNLKTTLLWVGGFALVSVFNYEKVKSGKPFFLGTLLESFGLIAFLSFISSSYTFSLPVELAIAFFVIVLVAASAIAETDGKLRVVHYLAVILLSLIAFAMLCNSFYHIATGFSGFATSHTVREFVVPMLLTAMFLPFLYGFYVYIAYDGAFNSFDFSEKDPALRRYMRRKLITGFGLDTVGLDKWCRHTGLFEPDSEAGVDASIAEIKRSRRREKRPYRVPPALGWLPNHAIAFLSNAGLTTNDYHRDRVGWQARSGYLKFQDGVIPNEVTYFVEGDEFVVSRLELALNVNSPDAKEEAYKRYFLIVSALVHAALPGAFRNGKALEVGLDEGPLLVNGYALSLRYDDRPARANGEHGLVFTIEIAA